MPKPSFCGVLVMAGWLCFRGALVGGDVMFCDVVGCEVRCRNVVGCAAT